MAPRLFKTFAWYKQACITPQHLLPISTRVLHKRSCHNSALKGGRNSYSVCVVSAYTARLMANLHSLQAALYTVFFCCNFEETIQTTITRKGLYVNLRGSPSIMLAYFFYLYTDCCWFWTICVYIYPECS